MIRDLAQTCRSALGVGLISSLGHLLWMSMAAICLFTARADVSRSRGAGAEAGGRRLLAAVLPR